MSVVPFYRLSGDDKRTQSLHTHSSRSDLFGLEFTGVFINTRKVRAHARTRFRSVTARALTLGPAARGQSGRIKGGGGGEGVMVVVVVVVVVFVAAAVVVQTVF